MDVVLTIDRRCFLGFPTSKSSSSKSCRDTWHLGPGRPQYTWDPAPACSASGPGPTHVDGGPPRAAWGGDWSPGRPRASADTLQPGDGDQAPSPLCPLPPWQQRLWRGLGPSTGGCAAAGGLGRSRAPHVTCPCAASSLASCSEEKLSSSSSE